MKTTLKKLWSGELSPWSDLEPGEREFRQIVTKVERESSVLTEKLDEDGRAHLKKFEDHSCEWMNIESENSFLKGFSLDMKMASEAFLKE